MRLKPVIGLLLGLLILGTGDRLSAQTFKISGTAGTYGEVYKMQGREARRDPTRGQVYIRPVVTVFNMSFPFEIMVSTEETRFRQPFNRFGINPRWRWMTFHAGDFNARVNSYISGVHIRGGGIDLEPKFLHINIVAGRSQKAVPNSYFKRNLWAVQMGIGRRTGTHWSVALLHAADDSTSIAATDDLTPQENLLLTTEFELRLFRGKFRIGAEGAGSLHSLDERSAALDTLAEDQIPQQYQGLFNTISSIFTPRLSTRADYSYKVATALRLRRANFQIRYAWFGPGFMSFGVPYLVNDRTQFNANSRVQIIPRKVTLSVRFNSYHDNLRDNKGVTNSRNYWQTGLNLRPLETLGMNLSYGRGTRIKEDSMRVTFEGTRMASELWKKFLLFGRRQTVRLAYSYQNSKQWRGEYDATNATLRLDSEWSSKLRGGISAGTALTTFQGQKVQVSIFGLQFRHQGFRRKLATSFSTSFRNGKGYHSLSSLLSSRLRLTRADGVRLAFRRLDYMRPSGTFHESIASISVDHRF